MDGGVQADRRIDRNPAQLIRCRRRAIGRIDRHPADLGTVDDPAFRRVGRWINRWVDGNGAQPVGNSVRYPIDNPAVRWVEVGRRTGSACGVSFAPALPNLPALLRIGFAPPLPHLRAFLPQPVRDFVSIADPIDNDPAVARRFHIGSAAQSAVWMRLTPPLPELATFLHSVCRRGLVGEDPATSP